MIKLKLHFYLIGAVGRQKDQSKDKATNTEKLSRVKELVKNQFGDRNIIISNESLLLNDNARYPNFFAAGWFISDEEAKRELVIVSHGESMSSAKNNMLENIKNVDWSNVSKVID